MAESTRLKPNDLFHTPDTADELWAWIDQLPKDGGVRLTAYTAAMMAWNLAARIVNDEPVASNGEGSK